jgi:hypothetical protein
MMSVARDSAWAKGMFLLTLLLATNARAQEMERLAVDAYFLTLAYPFYPEQSSACIPAAQGVHIKVGNGIVIATLLAERGDGTVVYAQSGEATTFLLGSVGCRIGVTIGKEIDGPGSRPNLDVASEWTPMVRLPGDRALRQTHYPVSSAACDRVDLSVRLQAHEVQLSVAARPLAEPTESASRASSGFQSPTGPLRGTMGRPGCEIDLLIFRAD